MSWNRTHHRQRLITDLLDEVARTGDPSVPARLRAEIDAEFGSLGGLLREVQSRWYRAFDARLDALLENWPQDVDAALAALWHGLAADTPGARLLLDAHLDHPELAALHGSHRRMLEWATGVRLPPHPAPPPPGTPSGDALWTTPARTRRPTTYSRPRTAAFGNAAVDGSGRRLRRRVRQLFLRPRPAVR